MSSAKSQRNQVSKVARQPKRMMVEVKSMKQLCRAVQNLTSQSASGARSSQARSASRGCKQCLNPAGRHGRQEAKVHGALKLLEQMGGRVVDFPSQQNRNTKPPLATSMAFVPGSQQSIEVMHPITHVKTAYRIGDHVYVSCNGENNDQTTSVGCVKQFGLQHGHQVVKVQWFYSPGDEIPMQDYYGEKELFQSNHYDIVPNSSLNGKCDVKYDVADYNDVLRGTPAEDDTWYTRYRCNFFKGVDGSISAKVIPTDVTKVCVREKQMKVGCGRPYNPDRFMLQCSNCDKLFHPECLQIPVSEFTEHSPIGRRCPRPACSVLGPAGLLQGCIHRDDAAHQHWQSV